MKLFALVALVLLSGSANAALKLSTADKAWIDTCANRLLKENKTPKSARVYCTCMHEQVENNEDMTQTEMERSWPPMHLSCRKEVGWR